MTLAQVLAGVAVVLAVEGLLYAVAPDAMRRAVGRLAELPEQRLRVGGLVAAAAGIGVAWLITR
ncbi:DUF2065 domain-containing protein [Falsiroseomonas sp. HW251]|uniref:DUF2065 domain-containing protein n=1 Tax=Falsiroseomonas sp. HW251 TaxID=3390998 RepID=UPI003D314C3E